MSTSSTSEILLNIVEVTFRRNIDPDIALAAQLPTGWIEQLNAAIIRELHVWSLPNEISSLPLIELSMLVEARLKKDRKGQSLVDIYSKLKEVASDAIYHKIDYRWFSSLEGDLFNESDSLERVEFVIRIEEEFGVSIPDEDIHSIQIVGETVRYLWGRNDHR